MILRSGRHSIWVSQEGPVIERWQVGGFDIFFPQKMVHVGAELRLRGGLHPCFPIFGSAPGHGPWSGEPRHGFLRNHVFEKIEAFGTDFVHFLYFAKDPNKTQFIISIHIQVNASGFSYMMEIRDIVPIKGLIERDFLKSIFPALHPYFNISQFSNGSLEIGGTSHPFNDIKNKFLGGNNLSLGGFLPHESYPYRINIPLAGIVEIKPQGLLKENGAGVYIWTDDREKYLCIEPCTIDPVLMKGKWERPYSNTKTIGCYFIFNSFF